MVLIYRLMTLLGESSSAVLYHLCFPVTLQAFSASGPSVLQSFRRALEIRAEPWAAPG